ncbi:beta strand repeat-containing protein [Dinghuibacter silviterrae]|uniref:Uncharacterized protein n=1 Tax=Dinghuibacter silviterrae TaxID=1539049 RepID=A0A4R8DU91_9BACT|nr:hypothetical protein [Dinghuibacter silviterrae]TDX01719.1 hypothetical protein EDB95_2761 [Dinghuibacter silviterrae]
MTRKLFLWVLSLQCLVAEGQQLKLGNNPSTINKSSLLELESNNQGLLLTRIPDTTLVPLTTAPTGTLIFFNGDSSFRLRKGGRWQTVSLSGLPWLLGGNTLSGVQNFGTLSSTDLPFVTGSTERMRLTSGGFLGIGTTTPSTALHVFGMNPLTLTGVQAGAATDSVLTITGGLVRKLATSNFELSGSDWNLLGNGSTNGATNFLGTTNSVGLHLRTNNVERMYLDSVNGTVGIGTNTFTAAAPEKLLVNAGTTTSYNAIVARGTVANYFQLNINNQSNNSGASSDVVATADNGTESVNYVDLGINSSQYNTSSITGGPDNAYLYSTGNDFVIGNASSGYNLRFFTGGTASTNEAMRVTGSGLVGIGTTAPATALHVFGTNPLTLTGVQTGATTDSVLTIASGLVRKLPATNFLSSGTAWLLGGNSLSSVQTLGTNNAYDLPFATNNTERMRLTSGGNLGIGITTPAAPLHVLTTNGTVLFLQTTTGGGGTGTANILFKTYSGTSNPNGMVGVLDDGNYSAHLLFSTKIPGADANALSERMRITSSGSVGIGTTTPGQKLDVNGTIVSSATTYPNYAYNSANRMAFGETNVPANETGSVVQYGSGSSSRNLLFAFTKTNVNTSFLGNDGTQMMLGSEASIPITFRTGLVYTATSIMASGTEVMRLTSGGFLGINTTTPSTYLHVFGTNPLTLTGVQTGATTDSMLTITNGLVRKLPAANYVTNLSSSLSGYNVTINSSTGSGTSFALPKDSLSRLLDVALASLSNGQLLQYNGSQWVNVTPSYVSSGTAWLLGGNTLSGVQNFGTLSSTDLPFVTGSTERMRLTAGGFLGIGTTTPSTALHVFGTNPLTLTGVQTGATTDSMLTITNGLVRKLPAANYVTNLSNSVSGYNVTINSSTGSGTSFALPKDSLNRLLDVTFTSPSNGQLLQYNGTKWVNVTPSYVSSGTAWLLGGNTMTGIQTLGTSNAYDLPFVTNNTERMRLTSGGFLGIGTTTPSTALHVFGTNPLTLTGVQTGATTDSVLTITGGLVRKLATSNFEPGGVDWNLFGNGSTNGIANFLGTTNSVGLHIRTNNVERMYLDSVNGTVGIGTNAFTAAAPEKLLVNAGTTTSYNAIVARGTVANYFQLNINNLSNNAGASSDVVATADNGTESVNYVDLGINSSQYNTSSITGGPDNAYLYSTGNDFVIGNASTGYNLRFFTGGTASTNEAMRITGSGLVGIGTTAPATALHVFGTNPLTLTGVQTGATTDSMLTITNGLVRKLPAANYVTNLSSSVSGYNVTVNSSTGNGTSFALPKDSLSRLLDVTLASASSGQLLQYNGTKWVNVTPTYLTTTGLTAGSIPFAGTGGALRQNNASLFWDSTNVRLGVGTNTPGSDFTVYQSTGATSKGIRLTGNSIGGTNTGTGAAMVLGFNQTNNKQLWLGDPDYMGNVNGTFIRMSTSNGSTILDAISGDNSTRRPIRVGYGNDALSTVILGDDGVSTTPSSYVWDYSNMAIGSGYRSSAAPTNGLLVQGNVGIGTPSPATVLHVFGTNPLTLTGVQAGATTDSLLTITSGLVRKLATSTFEPSGVDWNLSGNGSTSGTTNFLGTTNNVGLHIRTNNVERMYLDSVNGTVGIGTNTFTSGAAEKLLVNAGTTTSYNAIVAKGTVANYFQLNINNLSNNSGASSDVVATADNGTESVNYVDLGINSSQYNTTSITGGPDNAYLYSTGNDFVIGNATSGHNLLFFTGGTATTNEAMRINSSGQVGIANTSPAANLDDGGTFKLGSSGTVLNDVIKGSYTVNGSGIAVPASGGTITQQININTVALHSTVMVSPETALPNGVAIAFAYCNQAGKVTIGFISSTLLGATIPSGTVFDITIIQ